MSAKYTAHVRTMDEAKAIIKRAQGMRARLSRGEALSPDDDLFMGWVLEHDPEGGAVCSACGKRVFIKLWLVAQHVAWRVLNERPGRSVRFQIYGCSVNRGAMHIGRK